MKKIDALIALRVEERRRKAQDCVSQILRAAQRDGHHLTLVGSLAKNRFRLHSDVDLLVHDAKGRGGRAAVERLVAEHFRQTDISYDLIFASDLAPERVQEFLDGDV